MRGEYHIYIYYIIYTSERVRDGGGSGLWRGRGSEGGGGGGLGGGSEDDLGVSERMRE